MPATDEKRISGRASAFRLSAFDLGAICRRTGEGGGRLWLNDGITSIYFPAAAGFRVYLSVPSNLTPATANAYRWHIQWTAASTTRSYYYAGSTRVAMRQGSGVYFLHGDHLGSTSLTTDVAGNKVGELRYTAYGETRYVWGATPTDRRYTGQRSEENGLGSLYDYGARFYSPFWAGS